jgi:membrane-associated phospholipid phosphatase
MRPSEIFTLCFLAVLAAVALAGTPPALGSALAFVALGATTALVGRYARKGSFVRDYFPTVTVVLVFMVLEPVILGVNPRTWDAYFAAVDDRWFRSLVSAWHGAFGRPSAFTDVVYVGYVSYYLVPLAAVTLARARGPEAGERVTFLVLASFWLSYAGYLLLPTSGPRLPRAEEALLMGGGAVSDGVRAFLHAAENTRLDAFPSGHTAVALVSAWAGGQVAPRLRAPLYAWAALVVFSTVYIHVHYAVDIVAGAALALIAGALSPVMSRAVVASVAAARRLAGAMWRAAGA